MVVVVARLARNLENLIFTFENENSVIGIQWVSSCEQKLFIILL